MAAVALSFLLLAVGVIYLESFESVSPAASRLMLIALFGMYVGFSILYAVYRLVRKLD